MTDQTADRPFVNEPTEVLRAALGLASRHAEQAARFRPAQSGDALPVVVDLLNAELQHREGALLPPPEGPEYTPCGCAHIEPEHRPDAGPCLVCDCTAYRPVPAVAPAVVESSADGVRDQLLHALDFSACLNAGYGTPEELLAAYDTSRAAPADQATVPADRAAVLRWAADHLDQSERLRDLTDDHMLDINAAANELRRMADETATTETVFTPPAHYRRDDGVDCCVHAIPVGPDSCQACRELADDQPASGPTVVDQVVAAIQAKAQALSVEAEEEMRRDLEEQAQVWHEAADLARRTGRKAARSAQPAAGARQDGAQR
ncbi:hypothetical protein ABZX82_01840 [Streptomyces griseoflavus]|uniref:hypothetical protein n=1 Tax=Streptomyces griseoflavus TaxID=35619 RepID=UPI0033BA385A